MKSIFGALSLSMVSLVHVKIWESLSSMSYLPHRVFYVIPPVLVWAAVLTDCLVALAFVLIFGSFLGIGRVLRSFQESRSYLPAFLALACFILARGINHGMSVLTLWAPEWYPFATVVKLVSAMVSVPAAILFALKTPRFVRDFLKMMVLRSRLAKANDHLEAVMDSTSDGILKVRYDWTVAYGNRAARELPDLILDRSIWDCFPGMRSTAAEQHLHAVMEDRITVEYEHYCVPYKHWYKKRVSPMDGGISIFFSDITHARMLEQELEKERWMREKRIQALSHLAGGLAHEISNPLAIIHGRASDLKDLANGNEPVPAGDVRIAAESILGTSDRAIRILRGLRGFGRDAAEDAREPASIYEVVDECMELQQARFERHHVDLRISMPAGLPYIKCREVQIGQILTNLLNNALDAVARTGSGERWIAVTAGLEQKQIAIDVTDSGTAIPEDVKEHLMEPFFANESSDLGLGVGLSLSRAIAEDHGGTLVLLAGGEHTCFRLSLPVSDPLEAATVVA